MQAKFKETFLQLGSKKIISQEIKKKDSVARRVGKQDNAESTSLK